MIIRTDFCSKGERTMILVLWSSPNDNGLTAAAKDAVCAGLEESGQTVEAVKLAAIMAFMGMVVIW